MGKRSAGWGLMMRGSGFGGKASRRLCNGAAQRSGRSVHCTREFESHRCQGEGSVAEWSKALSTTRPTCLLSLERLVLHPRRCHPGSCNPATRVNRPACFLLLESTGFTHLHSFPLLRRPRFSFSSYTPTLLAPGPPFLTFSGKLHSLHGPCDHCLANRPAYSVCVSPSCPVR